MTSRYPRFPKTIAFLESQGIDYKDVMESDFDIHGYTVLGKRSGGFTMAETYGPVKTKIAWISNEQAVDAMKAYREDLYG